jgi:methionyl-tRNA formyltransferase
MGEIMTDKEHTYIVVGCKSWNKYIFDTVISRYPGNWVYIDDPGQISEEVLGRYNPRYIFFLHWSRIVPDCITELFECVCFHMTDVPFGRGGSPLQNLILRGYEVTKLSALRMVHGLDAGPVYIKHELSLNGSAEEIYMRATRLAAKMIEDIILHKPVPEPQSGNPELFRRRTPEQSELPQMEKLDSVYDFIRMLDADDYPHAFLEYKGFRFEFRRASLYDQKIIADVVITKIAEQK